MDSIKKINPSEYGLDEQKVTTIEAAFMPKIVEREALKEIYERVIVSELTPALCKEAGEIRRKLVKVRTGIADIHKTQKAFYLAAGRFVDAWKNKETEPIEQMEASLSEIETHFERIEAERLALLKLERIAELTKVCENPEMYNAEYLSEKAFDDLFTGLKLAKEAREKAEAEAEAERIRKEKEAEELRLKKEAEEKAEQERIRKENERLKAEAEEKEKQLAAERAKAEAERKKIEEAAKKEREEAERKLKAEQEAARIAAEKAAAEKAKLEKEIADKKAAEEKAIEEKRKAEEKAAKAPKKQKLNIWIDSLNCAAPIGLENDETTALILEKFESFKKWAKVQIENA